jgi:hypothetical protein
MEPGNEDHSGQVPLPEFGGSTPGRNESARSNGVRHVRRMSNWTAAALIAGTGAATVALAHSAVPSAVSQAGTTSTSTTTGTGAAAPAHAPGGPQVTHSVATSSGSGVTVTTTTHTANGKTVITRTRHAAPYSDN